MKNGLELSELSELMNLRKIKNNSSTKLLHFILNKH